MKKTRKEIILLFLLSILSSALIVLFFKFFPPKNLEIHHPHGSNEVIERNYDSPIYIVIAKTLYSPEKLRELNFNHLPVSYFANHFPLYPLIIRLISVSGINYFLSSLIITWLSSALFTVCFYLFLIKYKLSVNPFKLSLISLFLPPRWLAIRSVPGTEPIFCLLVIICFYLYQERKYFYSALILVFITLTRPPGIIFFFSFMALIFYDYLKSKNKILFFTDTIRQKWYLFFAPISLLGLFYFFQINFGNFFAYFQTGTGTNIALKSFPFAFVTGYNTSMSEGFFYLFFVYSLAIYLLWRQKRQKLAIFCLIYFIPNFFMVVDDLYRYLIPISAFLLIPFDKYFQHNLFKYVFVFVLIGIFIYTLSLLPNRMFAYDDYARLRLY
jgi:hypothetical protein